MAFKTNPYLDELEKKHPKLFFIIGLIVSVVLIIFGLWYLVAFKEDKDRGTVLCLAQTAFQFVKFQDYAVKRKNLWRSI